MVDGREQELHVERKPDGTLVTNIDYAVSDLTIDSLHRVFPSHRIKGEERSLNSDSEEIWDFDPLDGTGEYVHGENALLLTCGFGIAKRKGNEIEVGLFYNPFRNEMYTAIRGLGAFLNDQRIQVNQTPFGPGIAYDYSSWDSAPVDTHKLESHLGPPLNHYSAIYQGCQVAAGNSAFSVFPGRTAHDIVPAAIIVSEAGGRVTDLDNRMHNWSVNLTGAVFSNGVVHDGVLNVLRST